MENLFLKVSAMDGTPIPGEAITSLWHFNGTAMSGRVRLRGYCPEDPRINLDGWIKVSPSPEVIHHIHHTSPQSPVPKGIKDSIYPLSG